MPWFVLVAAAAFCIGVFLGGRAARSLLYRSERNSPSREQLLSWLGQAPVGWLMVDGQNRIRFINGKAEKLLRTSNQVAAPVILGELANSRRLIDLVESSRRHHQPLRIEWDFANQELEVFAMAGRKDTVAMLLQSRRSLEAQLHQQERWVSDVAHELKTPLTALLLVADSLAASATDHNAVLLERLLKELRRMQNLVGDLLELSRLENALPGEGIRDDSISMPTLLQDVWQGIKPMADTKGVKLDLKMEEHKAPPLFVCGDRQRLHRALLNLFDNALRHSPEAGTIHVDLRAGGDWMRIGIRDEGAGLSEQDLEHMFERFYRGDISRFRQKQGGTGLGLAIVQQIVLTHGGWVFGENDTDGGARFEVRLPLKQPA